ncbi:hypothetical protein [Rivularia sp. UHCC 0363]|uniref:hypothetical protein n=1 Tax=Rivularia sp. UHCC 0363 TaxID=3110244 RepID=UPI002B211A25|nr:hypothetical protein [Rivularia sp. UHCC 0363]MEA5598081.1 hypothetical protein [Rivularia sp. UHCC 0363]
MISAKKGFLVAVLSLIIGCSANNSANSVQTATQSPNPAAIEENIQSNNRQTTASAKPDNKSENTLIIPGERVGAVTPETTRADLVKIFGESNLKDDTILQAEGTVSVPATKVNSDTKRAFIVFWKDETRQKIAYIQGFGSEWKTPEGIGIGTALKELRQKLGEFKLTGFGWDYGGSVNLAGTNLSKYQGQLSLVLDPDEKAYEKYSKQYISVSGDQELSSTNPNLQPLDVRVNEMTVSFDK